MSHAFKKESDTEHEIEAIFEPRCVLPSGVKNYITEAGAARFLEGLRQLGEQRSRVLETLETSGDLELRRRLRLLDQKIAQLQKRVNSFHIVTPNPQASERVLFGATVTVVDGQGDETTYQICGVDESEPEKGKISWISPLAKALLGKELGEEVQLRLPRGSRRLEIVKIR